MAKVAAADQAPDAPAVPGKAGAQQAGSPEEAAGLLPPKAVGRPSGWFTCLTRNMPTNYSMLLFRTANADLHQPNANADHLAALFRDHLMPLRGCINSCMPPCLRLYKMGVEHPKYGTPGVINFVDARTQWFDAVVQAAMKDGIKQVVVVAAGFDTRAYRLAQPGVQWFEVDLPHASAKKQALVARLLPDPAQHPRPAYIAADLATVSLEDALTGSAFDRAAPSLFTIEGLIYYLPQAAVERLLAGVARLAAPGSRCAFDFLHADVLSGARCPPGYAKTAQAVAAKGEPFLSGLPAGRGALAAWLAARGWQLLDLLAPRELSARMHPHLAWSNEAPPILSFYSYAAAQRACSEAPPGEPAMSRQ